MNTSDTARILRWTALSSVLLAPVCANAATYIWTGASDADWNNTANWSGNVKPVDSDGGTANLELSATNADRIEFSAVGSANPVPTSNIPALGGNASNREHQTPQFDVRHGSLTFSAVGFSGQGLVKKNTVSWTNTVGDGNIANGLASLRYNGGFSQGIHRDQGGTMVWTVNADGTLIFDSGSTTTLIVDYGTDRNSIFNLNGGSMVSLDAIDMLRSAVGPGNSYIDFLASGSTFTADFGADFADLAAVQTSITNSVFFKSTAMLSLGAVDNTDGTFTVSVVPEPASSSIAALGLLSLACLRRKR